MSAAWAAVAAAPLVGSFLACAALRLPRGKSLWGRSACPRCGRVLGPLELVPLLSWAAAKGCCRGCGQAIPAFYPAVELAAVAVAFLSAALLPGPMVWGGCLLGWALLLLAAIDWRFQILPDLLTLPLLLSGLLLAESAFLAALAAACGWGAFTVLALSYRRLRGREGLGGGDAKLLAAAGAWVGPPGLPWVVLLGAGAALLWVGLAAWRGGGWEASRRLPFGPFLAAAFWTVWIYVEMR